MATATWFCVLMLESMEKKFKWKNADFPQIVIHLSLKFAVVGLLS